MGMGSNELLWKGGMFAGIGIMEFMWCELSIWGKDIRYMISVVGIELLDDCTIN